MKTTELAPLGAPELRTAKRSNSGPRSGPAPQAPRAPRASPATRRRPRDLPAIADARAAVARQIFLPALRAAPVPTVAAVGCPSLDSARRSFRRLRAARLRAVISRARARSGGCSATRNCVARAVSLGSPSSEPRARASLAQSLTHARPLGSDDVFLSSLIARRTRAPISDASKGRRALARSCVLRRAPAAPPVEPSLVWSTSLMYASPRLPPARCHIRSSRISGRSVILLEESRAQATR